MSDRPRPVTVCVVNYNGARYLPETLDALLAQTPPADEVLLADNGSDDGSLALVAERFPTVKVVALPDNRGPGAARNAGFGAAAHDLILFLDNDVTLAPDCLATLARALAGRPSAAVVVPRVLHARAPGIIQYDGAEAHFLGLMALRTADRPLDGSSDLPAAIGSLATACFLLDRARWGAGMPFDEAFFFNYEDHDFGLRTRLLGHEIVSVPAARCLHRQGTPGLSWRAGGRRASLRVVCLVRNRWQLILKNYAVRTLLLLAPALAAYEAAQVVAVLRKGWTREWLRAAGSTAARLPEILRARRAVQRARRTPDRAVLCGGPLPFAAGLATGRIEQAAIRALDLLVRLWWTLVRRFI